ncbi:LutC/YkgG family protein [Plantactinospora soyae]|uniref:L-lactate dehydrogenase complex protein LldG n=1 Tax=Plantactinospora soyae TaxID=1544732 RepID=A0A927QVR1_9ACTN|nr:LUD domain-containing protein [Plantactinospora soyae]MBE1484682.1 L-lactate dehydrogenase complex protein LldG [Plantactinospora soyae]
MTSASRTGGAAAGQGSARDEVLARIRAARPTEPVRVPRDYHTAPATGTPDAGQADRDRVELLIDRLVDYRATVRRCTPDGVTEALAELLGEVPTVVVPAGVPEGWLSAYPGGIRRDGDPDPLTVADLDAPGLAVLTGCAVAIAETGTLILDGGPDQGRRLLSLVPDHHLCVVRTDQVVGGLPEALARLADPTRPLTLVSGPSATSDIELDRVEGVHGPRRLEVLIVDG